MLLQFLLSITLLGAPGIVHSSFTLMNVSIDDSSPDPITGARITYGLVDQVTADGTGWAVGQNCTTCFAQPDPSQAFDRTWHDTSTAENGASISFASVSFTGVAVYVMGIIISSTPETSSSLNNSRIFFQVDGVDQGNFTFDASLGTAVVYSYNTTFFAREDLPNGPHNVTMMCGDAEPLDSVCLLDRFIYTMQVDTSNTSTASGVDEPTVASTIPPSSLSSIPSSIPSASATKSQKTLSTAAIAGLVSGLALLAALLIGACFLRRRLKRSQDSSSNRISHTQTLASLRKAYSEYSEDQNADETNNDPDRYADANRGFLSYRDFAEADPRSGTSTASQSIESIASQDREGGGAPPTRGIQL